MNSIDYDLEIIGEKITYKPRKEFIEPIVNSKKKIFEITADNSYGKTFFLNLLAYGLEADKFDDDRILRTIKESVSRYDDKSSYNLEYEIDLNLPDNRKLTLSKKNGRDKIIQIDNGAPLNFRTLHKDLSVIYDVPTNPSERLNAVIKDLGNWNGNLKEKFTKVSRYFFEVSKEFDSVRNEDKILSLQKKSKDIDKEILQTEAQIKIKNEILIELNKIKNLENLTLLLKKANELESKLVKKEKQFNLLTKPAKVEKKDTNLIKELNAELASLESRFKHIISTLIGYINSDTEIFELINNDNCEKHYRRIKETGLRDIFDSTDYTQNQMNFIDSLDYIKDEILRFILAKKNDKSYMIHSSYSEFIKLLEELMEKEIDYLLKNATSLDSKTLKQQLEELVNQHKIKNYEPIISFLNSDLKPLKGFFAQFMRTQNKLNNENKKKLVNDDDSKYYQTKAELDDLKASIKQVKNSFNIAVGLSATELNISDLSRLDSISKISDIKYNFEKKVSDPELLETINSSIGDLEKSLKKLETLKQEKTADKKFTEKAFEMEDAKNPSKYSDDQKKIIKGFILMLNRINANLNIYEELISKIESGDLSKFKDEEDVNFMELAGKIIAYSMDNKLLRADGEFVDLKFYDMRKQEFHCENDLIIKKADVSTGLASANYLKQRIENVEGKYVVVLLDEIGNMAQNALNTVVESIKKLEEQNRLVIAVFTRPNSNGIKILEY